MSKSGKKCMAALAAFCITLFAFWLGGYEFDKRGALAVMALIYSIMFAGLASMFPFSDD